ncbi:MAG TPA: hypothetical protein VF223_16590 [Trebonia sp.]
MFYALALGLRPTTLSEGLLTGVREVAAGYTHRADPCKIVSRSLWRAGEIIRVKGSSAAGQEKTTDYVTVFAVMLRTVRPR